MADASRIARAGRRRGRTRGFTWEIAERPLELLNEIGLDGLDPPALLGGERRADDRFQFAFDGNRERLRRFVQQDAAS